MDRRLPYLYTAIASAFFILFALPYYLSQPNASERITNDTGKLCPIELPYHALVSAAQVLKCPAPANRENLLKSWNQTFRSLRSRNDIGAMLECFGLETGAELGVQQGLYSAQLLRSWPSCKRFYLVDAWRQQKNYLDIANKPNDVHECYFAIAKRNLQQWRYKTTFLRMFTSEAAKRIPDGSLDFVYVDARHDYCGTMEDILMYWSKLRVGGVMAGDDYYYPPPAVPGVADYTVCADGTRRSEGTKGAVDDYAKENGLFVTATPDNTWMFVKNVWSLN